MVGDVSGNACHPSIKPSQPTRFRTILADPPWRFEVWSEKANNENVRLASAHYDIQDTEWIASLPVDRLADEDCVLFLWATWPMMPAALRVIAEWGFTFKTLGFDWVKVSAAGNPLFRLGYWTRANTEPCLLATRGKPKRMDKGVSQVIVSGVGAHSEKPEQQYDLIERLVEGPYCELFHSPRNGLFPPRENWTFIGNEVDGLDIREALERLAR